jgi:NAD(P)-dependent dehydrogenase (short-subunit alcohol dehydrogenase family)
LRNRDVVLITGGARGVGALIAAELAIPGVRIAIVGRGEIGPEDIDTDTSPEAVRTVREQIIARSMEKKRNLKPAALEQRVQRTIQLRERTATIARLRKLGAEVIYAAVDVRDEEKFPAFIGSLYDRFGHIEAVIHAAGLMNDKLLKDKSQKDFDSVFDTKADSLFLLARSLRPEKLKWLALFSSASGRFGNPGQTDYAAANEMMTRWAWHAARQWPSARVFSCCWGAWDQVGMISAPLSRHLRERGHTLIAPAEGCRFFVDELARGASGDCEVIAGMGPWANLSDAPRLAAYAAVGAALSSEPMRTRI